jgi:hypothetical protein
MMSEWNSTKRRHDLRRTDLDDGILAGGRGELKAAEAEAGEVERAASERKLVTLEGEVDRPTDAGRREGNGDEVAARVALR